MVLPQGHHSIDHISWHLILQQYQITNTCKLGHPKLLYNLKFTGMVFTAHISLQKKKGHLTLVRSMELQVDIIIRCLHSYKLAK